MFQHTPWKRIRHAPRCALLLAQISSPAIAKIRISTSPLVVVCRGYVGSNRSTMDLGNRQRTARRIYVSKSARESSREIEWSKKISDRTYDLAAGGCRPSKVSGERVTLDSPRRGHVLSRMELLLL